MSKLTFGNVHVITSADMSPDTTCFVARSVEGKLIGITVHNIGLPDGVACKHPGCLNHISHPCEGCGRLGGRQTNE